jgi:hypothetical protein
MRRSAPSPGLLGERGNGVTLVDLVGWPDDDLGSVVDRLAAQRAADGTVMILATDSDRFDLFRARGFVFEYLSGGADRAERIAELSIAYRADHVLVAGADGALHPAGRGNDGNTPADLSSSDAA